jgi:hypothetical protein
MLISGIRSKGSGFAIIFEPKQLIQLVPSMRRFSSLLESLKSQQYNWLFLK